VGVFSSIPSEHISETRDISDFQMQLMLSRRQFHSGSSETERVDIQRTLHDIRAQLQNWMRLLRRKRYAKAITILNELVTSAENAHHFVEETVSHVKYLSNCLAQDIEYGQSLKKEHFKELELMSSRRTELETRLATANHRAERLRKRSKVTFLIYSYKF